MHETFKTVSGWTFGSLLVIIGILNIALVHVVPGVAYLLVSLFYLPPTSEEIKRRLGFGIPIPIKFFFGVLIMLFTLGVSDLGDMID